MLQRIHLRVEVLTNTADTGVTQYDWPGNVRELQNVVERELIRYQGGSLSFKAMAPYSISKQNYASAQQEQENVELVTLDEAMAQHIRKALGYTKGRISGKGGAAELLDINPSTLRSRIEKLGIR